jgi:phospholipid transport system substrate-binding protein
MKTARYLGLVLAMMVLPAYLYAATPTETVKVEVDKIVDMLRTPGFKSQPKETQIAKIREIINKVFDYEELSKRTLGRNWRNFSAAQQQEFMKLFSELLEKVYADRILAYTDEKILFDRESDLGKGKSEVQSQIVTADGRQIPLYYRMFENGGQWKVYDVVIEGVSMVENYRSQFRDILSKNPPEELLNTLRKKVGESATTG